MSLADKIAALAQAVGAKIKAVQSAIPAAGNTSPAMAGTASAGVASTFSRSDHVHPTDTSLLVGKNLLINGAMNVDQRNSGSAQTIIAGAPLAYTVDRWWAACTGANVTGQQVAGMAPNANNYRFTGASGNTGIMFGQRVEAINSQHLAGSKGIISVDLANSLLSQVNWSLYSANTKDTFGTLASPSKTLVASGSFSVTPTLMRYSLSAPISVDSSNINGLELVLTVGAQSSGDWTIGRVMFDNNIRVSPYEYLDIGTSLFRCQRYYQTDSSHIVSSNAYSANANRHTFPVVMRKAPSVVYAFDSGSGASIDATQTRWAQVNIHSNDANIIKLYFDAEMRS